MVINSKVKYLGLTLGIAMLLSLSTPTNHPIYAKDNKDDGLVIEDDVIDGSLSFSDGVVGEGLGELKIDESKKEPLPETGKKVFKYLNKNYKDLFPESYRKDDVVYSKYDPVDFRTVYYGSPSSAGELQENEQVHGYWRYLGVEYTRYDVTHNTKVYYDYCTDGTVLARSVIKKPYENKGKLHTDSNIISNTKFDNSDLVKLYYNEIKNSNSAEVKAFKKKSGSEIRAEWGKLLVDKYAESDNIKRNQKHSSCYKRPNYKTPGMTADHIAYKWPDDSKKINYFHVTVPPTELTDGQAYEWHNGGSRYDGFRISYNKNANFKAVNIFGTMIANIYSANFGVLNTETHEVDTGKGLPSGYALTYNDVVIHTGESPPAPWVWEGGEVKELLLFTNIQLPLSMLNEKFTLKGKFNLYEEDDFYESTYEDNVIEMKDELSGDFAGPEFDATCMKGYMGTAKKYQNEETVEGTDETVCVDYSVALNHAILVNTLDAKYTTLTGIWSSNSKGHYKYKKEIAAKDISKANTYRANGGVRFEGKYAISKPITKTIIVPGITKLGKVIRAGRSVEMYSGIAIQLISESFTSTSAAKSQVNAMYNYMTTGDKFVNRGTRVEGEGSKEYFLKNNKGKEESPAQIDGNRQMKVLREKTSTQKFGSDNCKVIYKYQAIKEWFVPIATKNVGGKQATQNGDFDPQNEYNVKTGNYKLHTHVDNVDGVYDMIFRNYVKPSIFDGALSSEDEFCDTTAEKFVIQGNIHDDIRTEDVTDKVKTEDFGW